MTSVLVVEDDEDVQFLIETVLLRDPRLALFGSTSSAEEALEMVRRSHPDIIVLDHGLADRLTGFEAAPMFKALAPRTKIILFTAYNEFHLAVADEPAIDAFVLKTNLGQLLPEAQQLIGIGTAAVQK